MAEHTTKATDDKPQADAAAGAAAIGRVAEEILPALIRRITASELGELEVAQGGWRVRLRREHEVAAPADASGGRRGRATGGASASASTPGGHASHGGISGSGHAEGHGGTSGTGHTAATANRSSVVRRTAVSPAVGYFTARDGLATGQAVRSGDVLGFIDMLGVPQAVVAPSDGIVGRILASAGEAVEYGQELVRIDGIERLVES